ncbi:MAG: tetratricopeptide repeat protein [Pseudomonadota bacterium]
MIARLRRVAPAGLARTIAGDLDAIVLKATAPDSAQRYASTRDLARDIERYLRHEPIEARPPAWSYHASRFVRRHRVPGRAEDGLPYIRTAYEGLRRTLGPDHPRTLNAMSSLAGSLATLGDNEAAALLLREVIEASRRITGPESPSTLSSLGNLGVLYTDMGRYGEAQALFTDLIPVVNRVEGEDHPRAVLTRYYLARVYLLTGRLREAVERLNRVIETQREVEGDIHPNTLLSLLHLGDAHLAQGLPMEASEAYLEAGDGFSISFDPTHASTIKAYFRLALCLAQLDRLADAEGYITKALTSARETHGERHPFTAQMLFEMARVRAEYGQQDTALEVLSQAIWVGYCGAESIRQMGTFTALDADRLATLISQAEENPPVETPFSFDDPIPGREAALRPRP